MTMSMRERRKRALMMYNALSGSADYPAIVAAMGYSVHNWAADDISTLFQDSAGNTPLTTTIVDGVPVPNDNQPIGRWVDRIQAVPATQGTTAAKPTFRTATLNGLPTLSFDGGDGLETTSISISTFAIWVVYRVTAGNVIYEHNISSTVSNSMGLLTSAIRVNRAGTSSQKGYTDATTTYRIHRHEFNGTHASHLLYKNNALVTLSDTVIGNPGTASVNQQFFIGARAGVSVHMTGNIAQLIIVSPYPTAEIITNMAAFVNGKWGVY